MFIAITILSIGQAIVSYEIFTGKVLPRQGLKRYWKLAILLSMIFGISVAWALIDQLEAIYLVLLSMLLITGIYAILGWRTFNEQEHFVKSLHPFITSQHLYDQLLMQNPATINIDLTKPFYALCKELLGVRQAFLIPLGIFGPLVGNAIRYPEKNEFEQPEELIAEVRRIISTNPGFSPVLLEESRILGKHSIAIPLWSERGLIGALVLGEKNNTSLFTLEEIEIARTVGERLIDSKASNELAHKLMELQRQHLSETQVLDQHTRRRLHDDILPLLQTTMIKLSSDAMDKDAALKELGEVHHQLTTVMRELPTIHEPELRRRGLIEALKVTIENEYQPCFNSLIWQIDESALVNTKTLPLYAADVLYHATREAVRNAARHGRQNDTDRQVNLHISISWAERMMIEIKDDGIGFGYTHEHRETSGQGLALHSTLMAVIGGSLAIESIPGKYTQVMLKLPA